MKFKSSLLLAVFAAFTLPVLAQTAPKDPAATPGIDKRQANQQQRIDQGVKSGQLTGKEAACLEKGQEHVQKVEDKAKADGTRVKDNISVVLVRVPALEDLVGMAEGAKHEGYRDREDRY